MMRRAILQRGFSLIELSIVLVIVGFLLGGIITGFAVYRENSLMQQAQDDLKLIHDALIGYAIQQGRLPCPDTDAPGVGGSGQENNPCAGGVAIGFIPFSDLGLSGARQDPWGNSYIYAVESLFTVPFNAGDAGNLLRVRNCNNGPACIDIAQNMSAVFYSLGDNDCGNFSVHEQENFDAAGTLCAALLGIPVATALASGLNGSDDQIFISAPFASTGANRFDDQIMWLSSRILIYRMLQAGLLPPP